MWPRRIYPKIIWLPKWSETGTFWSHLAALCGCGSSIRSSLMMEFYWAVYNYISKVLLDVYSHVFPYLFSCVFLDVLSEISLEQTVESFSDGFSVLRFLGGLIREEIFLDVSEVISNIFCKVWGGDWK